MRRLARSEKLKILRGFIEGEGVEEEEVAGAAEIGSRVFPLRSPTQSPASMPSVSTRRSTRVFVSRQQQRPVTGDGDPAGVLRSGKQFALATGDGRNLKQCSKGKEKRGEPENRVEAKKLIGEVYSRKRRRSTSNGVQDHEFGIVFKRKQQTFVQRVSKDGQIIGDSSKRVTWLPIFEKFGILDSDLWTGLDCDSVVLVALVDSSVAHSSDRFEGLLVSVMNWLRKERVELVKLTALLSRTSLCSVFSKNGIHFLPIQHQQNRILDRNSVSGVGFCKIHGGREFVPLLSIDYSATPSYFKFLHATTILGSQYLSSILGSKYLVPMIENSLVVVAHGEHVCDDGNPLETGSSGTDYAVSETPAVKMDELPTLAVTSLLRSLKSVIIHGAELRKLQRKRSTLTKTKRSFGSFSSSQKISTSFSSSQKISTISSRIRRDSAVPPVSVTPLDSRSPDLFSGREENVSASFPGSSSMLRKSAGMKTSIDKVKELRLALAEVRQNIDSACCNVNILVTDTKKSWREDWAQVMLEMSGSQEWFLAVKRENVTRFLYKPRDLKLCTVNKYTNAYMWSGDEKWKLEFREKFDWYIFKELHTECRDRNTPLASVKTIPIPGVKEVFGYEDDVFPSFIRPDTYIRITEDEVGRAMASGISYYNMDLADEEWLRNLNSRLSDAEGGGSRYISEEYFERVMFALEKSAYCCRDDAFDKEKALDLLQEFGRRDVVSAVYSYWLKRRKKKRGPIARVFQGLPLRRTEVNRKSSRRKKRSFKRRQSQTERNQAEWKNQIRREKQELFFKAYREAIRRARESKGAVSRTAEIATQLRSRAQVLMSNADLAAYKASMALRIAETISTSSSLLSSESPNVNSCILAD